MREKKKREETNEQQEDANHSDNHLPASLICLFFVYFLSFMTALHCMQRINSERPFFFMLSRFLFFFFFPFSLSLFYSISQVAK